MNLYYFIYLCHCLPFNINTYSVIRLTYQDIQGYRETGIQGCSDTEKQNTGMQGYRDTWIQGYMNRGIHGYRDIEIKGCKYTATGILTPVSRVH